jgi:hypothetical protein
MGSAIAGSRLKLFTRLLRNSHESEVHIFEGTPCWEWNGYRGGRGSRGRISMRIEGKKNPQGLHPYRVMAELVLGRPLDPDRETIEHACEIPWCINFLHLRLATRKDNTADMMARRRGRERKVFPPLVDEGKYIVDRFIRALPVLRTDPQDEEAPF